MKSPCYASKFSDRLRVRVEASWRYFVPLGACLLQITGDEEGGLANLVCLLTLCRGTMNTLTIHARQLPILLVPGARLASM